MMRLWKFLKGKALSDRADSILVPALFLIPVIALVMGIAVEVQKNNYVRSERINAIQDSASSAVTLTDSRGSLNWKVVDRVVNEYEQNRFGGDRFSSSANTRLNYDDDTRDSAESKVFENPEEEGCLVGTGDDEGQRFPQYKITLDTGRGNTDLSGATRTSKTVSFTRTQPSIAELNRSTPLNTIDPATGKAAIYRSVQIEVIDQAPNLVMNMAGVPCQKFDLSANAVTFSANADLN